MPDQARQEAFLHARWWTFFICLAMGVVLLGIMFWREHDFRVEVRKEVAARRAEDRKQEQTRLDDAGKADTLSVQARRLSCRRGDIIVLRDAEGWNRARARASANAAAGGQDAAFNAASSRYYKALRDDLLKRVVRCDLAHPYPGAGPPRSVTNWKFIRAHRLRLPAA